MFTPAVDPLPIRYRFSRADYLALSAAMARPWWLQILSLLPVWLFTVFVVAVLLANRTENFSAGLVDFVLLRLQPVWLYGVLGVGLALVLLGPLFTRLQAMQIYRHIVSAEQDVTGEIGEGGIRTATPGLDSRLEWSAVRRVMASDTHMFLAVSGREALVLPKRAFATPEAFAAALALARRKVPAP